MTDRFRRFALALAAVTAIAVAGMGAPGTSPAVAGVPVPLEAASMQTPPPISATATPQPSGNVVKYAGEILDYRDGFVFFTTGDAFRIGTGVKIDDAATGGPTRLVPGTFVFARASFDTGNGAVVELGLSSKRLPDDASYDAIKKFAVALSTPYADPDLAPKYGYTGHGVPVTFLVEVPPKTPFSDEVYLATDASNWTATEIRMDRVDALHYKATRDYPSGTKLLYRYTRGSWQSADVDQNGIAMRPRVLIVKNTDVRTIRDVVYAWQDENIFAPDNGTSYPTPFNPVPFNVPPVATPPGITPHR